MDEPIKATYENGVFRPLTPPDLPEHEQVHVFRAPTEKSLPRESDDEIAANQRAALLKMLQEVREMPQHRNNDGWDAANNVDELLYGGPDGPL